MQHVKDKTEQWCYCSYIAFTLALVSCGAQYAETLE